VIYECAGVVGVNPDPFTLRELLWMREGKASESWDHTAAIVATLANIHRDNKKTKAITIDQIHPYLKPQATNKPLPMAAFKQHFCEV